MRRATLDALRVALAAKRPVVLLTELDSGRQRLVDPVDGPASLREYGAHLEEAVARAVREDRSAVVPSHYGRLFVHVFNPPLRLVLVGAVHIAQALVPLARLTGYAVTVVDPRRAFATAARFPGVDLIREWPDKAMAQLGIDQRTAAVTLTHDPKFDDPALSVALRSRAFYVGALGSRRTHALRCDRLRELGLTEAQIARVHAPVGLAIGACSPAEIALAVMAEITAVLRRARAP